MTEDYSTKRGRKRLWTYVGWLKRRAAQLDRKCAFMRHRARTITDKLRASKQAKIKGRNSRGQFLNPKANPPHSSAKRHGTPLTAADAGCPPMPLENAKEALEMTAQELEDMAQAALIQARATLPGADFHRLRAEVFRLLRDEFGLEKANQVMFSVDLERIAKEALGEK